jgi:hypothetical protein
MRNIKSENSSKLKSYARGNVLVPNKIKLGENLIENKQKPLE